MTSVPHIPSAARSGADFGQAVADAWYTASGSSRMDIPVGVVAALALWPVKTEGAAHAGRLASYFAAQPGPVLVQGYAECFSLHWMRRPDLLDIATPITQWTEEELNETLLHGVRAVTRAAVQYGVLHYTGASDPAFRSAIDLMSWAVTSLRHHRSRKGLGEYHTPPDIADALTRLTLEKELPRPGDWFCEPTAGTGSMFRSFAETLRDHNLDPHDFGWMMQDLDPIAAAAGAVNVIVWDLGPRALVACGDILAQGDLSAAAHAHQREMFAHRDLIVNTTRTAVATHKADRLLNSPAPDSTAA
ncbi:N-6 DNA methylase [Streptomyces netropsis]|uniref:N-6 DNA methylase n=1 Tax=Streptomyces netropsis TaxID=55404 RepID=UPI00378BE01E